MIDRIALEQPYPDLIRALYYSGSLVVHLEEARSTYGLGFCDPWLKGEETIRELPDTVQITASWKVDFGKAKKLESRMLKALQQMPKTGGG